MQVMWAVIIVYIVIINIVAFSVYAKEAISPVERLSPFWMFVPQILGGAFGACLANYIFDTEYRELKSRLHIPLLYLPTLLFALQVTGIIYISGHEKFLVSIWESIFYKYGILGYYLAIINVLAFVLVFIRKLAYFVVPYYSNGVSDWILLPVIILGGATGGAFAKILFNFKEDWSCNTTKKLQNFVYNNGMFLISAIHIGLYIHFLCML
jgi:uncharacterized membrane protein YsdA (DUF1294 family)